MRRYLANKYSPLSKLTSLALTFLIYQPFHRVPQCHIAFRLHSVLQMRKLRAKGHSSFYYTVTALDRSKKRQLNILASKGEIIFQNCKRRQLRKHCRHAPRAEVYYNTVQFHCL